ncbi:MAG: hypothetical protein CEE42_13205 [Promethearchaeota archaeon Loki_b31]|nr:MAG: hypothetical protein CEE42_13205 [Candidatus Lokiarchaeota archaeon Loki_b31]
MNSQIETVNRKVLQEESIAICSQFGCNYIKKIKPLKFKIFGFRKYPKCSNHHIPLVFIDEFVGKFITGVNACLFDISSLPPKQLLDQIKHSSPEEMSLFVNAWMYSSPIGRGAEIVSKYFDGLSRGYIKALSRKQRSALNSESTKKNHYKTLRQGLKKLVDDYTLFLRELRDKSGAFYEPEKLIQFSRTVQNIIENWMKNQLNTIQTQTNKKNKESDDVNDLIALKEKYDKILNARTSTLLLGIPLDKKSKKISAFELFSAYNEFFHANLSKEVKKEDVEHLLEEFNYNYKENRLVHNGSFENLIEQNNELRIKHIIKDQLELLFDSISIKLNLKNTIITRSLKILDEFIIRFHTKKVKISEKTDLKAVSAAIIYAVLVSNEKMPKINISDISKLPNYTISKYYGRYFKELYMNKQFNFPPYYNFQRIRDLISFDIFEKIILDKSGSKISNYALDLQKNCDKLRRLLSKEDLLLIQELYKNHFDKSVKYFSELAETIKYLYTISIMYKKIRTNLIIKPLAKYLFNKEITMFQGFKTFYNSIIEIFDFLYKKFPDILPKRSKTDNHNEKLYSSLIGSRIKLYLIKNLYNGKFFKSGKGECPECKKEGYKINTNISRLKALEFHHTTDEKEHKYSATVLYELFNENRDNPLFLENLIKSMELKKITLICANHHDIVSSKYYNFFRHLISWKDLPNYFPDKIQSLSPELIHALIKISINAYPITKNLNSKQKAYIKLSIISLLKRKYIIETLYGESCQICGEFNTIEHLVSFHFNHIDETKKTLVASNLFKSEEITCSEIVSKLDQERGGYLCNNCHTVFHRSSYYDLLEHVYIDENVMEKVSKDHIHVKQNFKLVYSSELIKDPFKLSKRLSGNFEKCLIAIDKLSKTGGIITNRILANALGVKSPKIVAQFFDRNEYLKQFIRISREDRITEYELTKKGFKALSLMNYFKKYYSSR